MVLDYQINDAARSLDQQQLLKWLNGWQVVDPGGGSNEVTAGSGDFEYDAASGDVNAGGTIVACSQETADFANDVDSAEDQIAVLYRDANGALQKSIGSLGTREPSGDDVRSTHTPAPPTLAGTDAVILAEVLLPSGAGSIGSDELRDRRLGAELPVELLTATRGGVRELSSDAQVNYGDLREAL